MSRPGRIAILPSPAVSVTTAIVTRYGRSIHLPPCHAFPEKTANCWKVSESRIYGMSRTTTYQQIPFQYSLHILYENGHLRHLRFLDLSGEDPSKKFSRFLIRFCDTQGPIFVYNAGFEKRVMRELAARFPDLAPALQDFIGRVVDLLPIARSRHYHPKPTRELEPQSCASRCDPRVILRPARRGPRRRHGGGCLHGGNCSGHIA